MQEIEEERRTAANSSRASPTFALLPKRLMVCWKGAGARRRRARSPPRRGRRTSAGSATNRLDDLGDAVGDVGEVSGERAHLVARAVNLDPGAVELPLHRGRPDARERVVDVSAVCASIGWTGRSTIEAEPASASAPSVERGRGDRAEVAGEHAARRTSPTGTRGAFATASTITPSRAPWRSSPRRSPTRNRCSSSVARPNRPSSSSRRARLGARPREPGDPRGGRVDLEQLESRRRRRGRRGARGARPSRRRSSPAAGTRTGRRPRRALRPGSRARGISASRATFASRDEVDATSADVAAISSRSTAPYLPDDRRPQGVAYSTSSSRSDPPEIASARTRPTPRA